MKRSNGKLLLKVVTVRVKKTIQETLRMTQKRQERLARKEGDHDHLCENAKTCTSVHVFDNNFLIQVGNDLQSHSVLQSFKYVSRSEFLRIFKISNGAGNFYQSMVRAW